MENFTSKYIITTKEDLNNIKVDIQNIVFAAIDLEKSLKNELAIQPTYLVTAKGGYDINLLTVQPQSIFPVQLLKAYPKLEYDVTQCSLALAFSLPTACVLHLMKVLEFLIKKYYIKKIYLNLKMLL